MHTMFHRGRAGTLGSAFLTAVAAHLPTGNTPSGSLLLLLLQLSRSSRNRHQIDRMERRAMETKRAAEESENPAKRQRVIARAPTAVPFDAANDDCLVHIATFLTIDELSDFEQCSRHCRRIRSDPSLDQTRTGTIICRGWSEFVGPRGIARYSGHFRGNRTLLKIVGLEAQRNLPGMSAIKRLVRRAKLPGVTSLDLSYPPGTRNNSVMNAPVKALSLMLPKLREVNLSYMKASQSVISALCKNCPNLAKVTWNGTNAALFLTGRDFMAAANLKELYMDNGRFYHSGGIFDRQNERSHDFDSNPPPNALNLCMWQMCQRLERVSMKNATWYVFGLPTNDVSQDMLIKFVRRTPTLRWLCSDLSEENIAMVKMERPEVTFVS